MAVNEITLSGKIASRITLAASLETENAEEASEDVTEDAGITYDYVGE